MRALASLLRALGRELARHPWQLGLTLVGIALGVAVVVAIELASESAHRGFVISSDAVMGRTTHVVEGPSRGVPAGALRALRRLVPTPSAAPVVEARVTLGGEPATLLGVDPLSEGGVRGHRAGDGEGGVLRLPDGALLARAAAARLGLARGERFTVRIAGREVRLTLAGFLGGGDEGPTRLVVVDIALAQTLLAMPQRFSRIDLVLPPAATGEGGDPETLAAVRSVLPPSTRLESAGARASARREMTRGFEINLRMLSLLSLALGALLVYNATSFSVARRRRLIGTLRALGVTREEVLGALLAEAVLLGVAGSALGVALGWWLATRLVVLVTRTMNDLYFTTEVAGTILAPGTAVGALALGIACSVLSAAWPAWRASTVPPRIALLRSSAEQTAHAAPRLALLGAGCLLAAYGLVSEPATQWLPAAAGLAPGYAALLAALAGSALLAPGAVVLAIRLALGALRRWRAPVVRPALRGVTAEIGRTSVAVTALMVALATTVGVTVMVGSFRHAVEGWLAGTLRAELYLTAADREGAPPITDALADAVRAVPGVAHLSLGRWARVNGTGGAVQLLALAPAPESLAGFDLVEARGSPWERFERGEGVLVSEPFAFRHRLRPGDPVRLRGESGLLERPVLATFRDYRTEAGFVLVARSLYDRYWRDPGYTGIGVYLEPGAGAAEVRRAIMEVLGAARGPGPVPIDVRSNRDLRERSLAIFDRTFAVTEVLRGVSALVAFVAVLSALLALELDRARERALMRALGYTRAQTLALVEVEGLAQGVVAGLLALPTGLVLSWLLVAVINRRSFGWSMAMHVDSVPLAGTVVAAGAAAALAGLYPAWRAARSDPARALREE